MATTKLLHFKCPYLRQNWSIPDSIIYSLTTNPSSANTWQKLIQSCKYFFAKNAILVVDELHYNRNGKWEIFLFRVKNGEKTKFSKSINFTNVLCKFWLTEKLFFLTDLTENAQPSDLVSSIIPYFYRCDTKSRDNPSYSSITSNTVKKLFEFPHISKITKVFLYGIPEKFDLETFYIYFKKNKHTKFRIHFRDTISEAYKIRIEEIVEEIIAAENHDYKIPFVTFPDLPNEKWDKIESLISQQNKQ